VADRLLGQRTQPRLTAVERQLPACEPILGPPVPDGRMAVLAVLSHYGRQAVREREGALALGVRVAVHDSRQNDRQPVIWQPGQDYRMADTLQAARTQPTRTRHGPERVGPER
jgi:hypothetical protein